MGRTIEDALKEYGITRPMLFYGLRGSRAYGMHRPDSDYDFTGVYPETPTAIFGPNGGDKTISFKKGVDDITIWTLRHFFQLLERSAPTAIEVLWSPLPDGEEIYAMWVYRARAACTANKQTIKVLLHCAENFIKKQVVGPGNKSGMCALRSAKAALHILETGDYTFDVDTETLLRVLAGRYDPIEETYETLEFVRERLKTSNLRARPDTKKLTELCCSLHQELWKGLPEWKSHL